MYLFISLRFSYLILELLYFWFSFEYTNRSYDGSQINALCMGIPTSSWSTICHDRSVVAHWKQAYCAPLPLCVIWPLVTQHSPIIPSQCNHIKFCVWALCTNTIAAILHIWRWNKTKKHDKRTAISRRCYTQQWWKVKVGKKQKKQHRMNNLETQATLDIRHKTMKTKKPNCSRRVSSYIISHDGLYNLMTQFKKKTFQ